MNRRAFTLIELLVAMAITAVLATLLVTSALNILRGWQNSQSKAGISVTAKLLLDQLERDLQSAWLRNDGKVWFDGRVASDLASHGWDTSTAVVFKPAAESLLLLPDARDAAGPQIADARFGQSGLWLRFIVSDYDGLLKATAPVAVSYQIVRRPVSSVTGAAVRYGLYREKLSATDTFNSVIGQGFTDTAPADLLVPTSSDLLASNVIDFGIWVSRLDANGTETVIFPVGSQGFQIGANGSRLVVWAMVRILSEEGAAQLDAIESGRVSPPAGMSLASFWWNQVSANSHVVVRRIELKGGSI